MIRPMFLLAGCSLLLSACVSTTTAGGSSTASNRPARATTAGMRPATNDHRGAVTATTNAGGHAGDLVGRDRAALIALFGQPRLDMQEGAGTKLQFSSERCVLDAYLYPARAGATAVVTHIDARTPEGEDMDRAGCIQALRRR